MKHFLRMLSLWLAVPMLATASPREDAVFWALSLYEGNLALKGICTTRFPLYAEAIEAAYQSSSYSAHSSETIIVAMTEGAQRQRLLDKLPDIRKKIYAIYGKYDNLSSVALESLCRRLPESLKQVATLLNQPASNTDRDTSSADSPTKP